MWISISSKHWLHTIWVPLVLYAQVDPANPVGPSIFGTVTSHRSGSPLVGHPMELSAAGGSITTNTDERGSYSFNVSPGQKIRIRAKTSGGFLGASRSLTAPASGTLRTDLALSEAGSLLGVVESKYGNLLPMIFLNLRSEGVREGVPVLYSSFSRRSDVNGRFSFEGLEKGRYVLEGSPMPITIKEVPEGTISNSLDRPFKYLAATTYHVNSSERSSATDLSIQNGSIFAHVKFIMLEEKTNCIALVAPEQPDSRNTLSISVGETYPLSQSTLIMGKLTSGKEFEACGLGSGSYLVSLLSNGAGGAYGATHGLEMDGRRYTVLPELRMTKMESVTGRVSLLDRDGKAVAESTSAAVNIQLVPKGRIPFAGEVLRCRSDESGRAVIPAALPGGYWVSIAGLPPGTFLHSVVSKGEDVLQNGLSLPGDFSILLGNYAGTITGSVASPGAAAPLDAAAIAVSGGRTKGFAANEVFVVRTDPNGNFTMSGVPPGEYDTAVFPGLPLGRGASEALISRTRLNSVRVLVKASGQSQVLIERLSDYEQ